MTLGLAGILALIVGIQGRTLAWGNLSVGEKLGIGIYGTFLGGCLVFWLIATYEIRKANKDILEGDTRRR